MSALIFRLRGTERSKLLSTLFAWIGNLLSDADDFIRVEIAVKQILCGMNIKVGASVANKECLDWYTEWAAAH